MTEQTVTVYQFSLAEDAKTEEFLAASEKADAFLKTCAGFQYRSLAQIDEQQWLDVVYWADAQSAEKANQAFSENQDCLPFAQAINHETAVIRSAKLVSNNMAEAS